MTTPITNNQINRVVGNNTVNNNSDKKATLSTGMGAANLLGVKTADTDFLKIGTDKPSSTVKDISRPALGGLMSTAAPTTGDFISKLLKQFTMGDGNVDLNGLAQLKNSKEGQKALQMFKLLDDVLATPTKSNDVARGVKGEGGLPPTDTPSVGGNPGSLAPPPGSSGEKVASSGIEPAANKGPGSTKTEAPAPGNSLTNVDEEEDEDEEDEDQVARQQAGATMLANAMGGGVQRGRTNGSEAADGVSGGTPTSRKNYADLKAASDGSPNAEKLLKAFADGNGIKDESMSSANKKIDKQFKEDLIAAFADGKITNKEAKKIETDIDNGAGKTMSAAQLEKLTSKFAKMAMRGGVTDQELKTSEKMLKLDTSSDTVARADSVPAKRVTDRVGQPNANPSTMTDLLMANFGPIMNRNKG